MTMNDKINIGDTVHVNFNNSQYTLCTEGIVISVPCQTGDSWIIKDPKTNSLYYISEGCTVGKKLN